MSSSLVATLRSYMKLPVRATNTYIVIVIMIIMIVIIIITVVIS